jgi:cell wall-associated NlpC family hydrolase
MLKRIIPLLVAFTLIFAVIQPAEAASTPLDSTIHKLLGVKYRPGGTTANGFDCSGFTSYVFKKFNIKLPHQSYSQSHVGVRVLKSNLRPGDLVFFNTNGRGISHVGIYTGQGKFAHAAPRGIVIERLNERYYSARYITARRILNEKQYYKIASNVPVKKVVIASSK